MEDQNVTQNMISVCKYYQTGYCRNASHCTQLHLKIICIKKIFRDKSCINRHPKICQYFEKYNFCRYRDQCSYTNAEIIAKLNTCEENDIDIKDELSNFRKEIKGMNEVKSKSTEQDRNTDAHEKNKNSLQCNIYDFVAASNNIFRNIST